MRYSVSGVIGAQIDSTETATGISTRLLGKDITSGRALWLKSFWAYDVSSAEVLILLDMSHGYGATASTKRVAIPCASSALTMVEFPAPGLKFSTGCAIVRDGTAPANATENFRQGEVGGAGYEE